MPQTLHHHHRPEDTHLAGATEHGKRVIKWSFAILIFTALAQVAIFVWTGSVALLADTVHNFADAFTALPLWFAFAIAQRRPSRRFTYGYGRLEDLAGMIIVMVILASAFVSGYESIQRIYRPVEVHHLWALIAAGLIGFTGNELVARYRIRAGEQIKSTALVADGHHARIDGLTSLAVVLSALGLYWGFGFADPLVGLIITLAIIRIAWQSGKPVVIRLMDGIDADDYEKLLHAAESGHSAFNVGILRARWIGHRVHVEIELQVPPESRIDQAYEAAQAVCRRLRQTDGSISRVSVILSPLELKPSSDHDHCQNHR